MSSNFIVSLKYLQGFVSWLQNSLRNGFFCILSEVTYITTDFAQILHTSLLRIIVHIHVLSELYVMRGQAQGWKRGNS